MDSVDEEGAEAGPAESVERYNAQDTGEWTSSDALCFCSPGCAEAHESAAAGCAAAAEEAPPEVKKPKLTAGP